MIDQASQVEHLVHRSGKEEGRRFNPSVQDAWPSRGRSGAAAQPQTRSCRIWESLNSVAWTWFTMMQSDAKGWTPSVPTVRLTNRGSRGVGTTHMVVMTPHP